MKFVKCNELFLFAENAGKCREIYSTSQSYSPKSPQELTEVDIDLFHLISENLSNGRWTRHTHNQHDGISIICIA